jgi:hypothetical protein
MHYSTREVIRLQKESGLEVAGSTLADKRRLICQMTQLRRASNSRSYPRRIRRSARSLRRLRPRLPGKIKTNVSKALNRATDHERPSSKSRSQRQFRDIIDLPSARLGNSAGRGVPELPRYRLLYGFGHRKAVLMRSRALCGKRRPARRCRSCTEPALVSSNRGFDIGNHPNCCLSPLGVRRPEVGADSQALS